MLLSFHEWYCYKEILELASIICISRESKDTSDILTDYARKLTENMGEVIIIEEKPFEVSSSQIRAKLKNHEDCSCYLNENVVQYIEANKLYHEG